MMDLDWWRTATIATAAVGQTLFVLLYATFPWYRTFLGRALFIKALTFVLLIDVAVAGRVWDWKYEEAWIVVLYGLTAFGIWAQLIAFIRQKTAHHQENKEYYHGTGSDRSE